MPRQLHRSGSVDLQSEHHSGVAIAIGLGLVLLAGIVLLVSALH